MDPVRNPYTPGAGAPPPELAGRDKIREQIRIAIERLRAGKSAKSVMLVGLRGVGKTVLLDQMRLDAESVGIYTTRAETPENRSLPALLAPQLRQMLLRMSRTEAAKDAALRGLKALTGFARSLKVKFGDIEVGFDEESEPGLADNGDLEGDLSTLLEQVGRSAKAAGTVAAMFLDEVQYLEEDQFAALISALHRCAQLQLPVTVVGAGLPQLRGLAGHAKSYAERLFDFPEIGALPPPEARLAIEKPAADEDVVYEESGVAEILSQTRGYPYFLQEWGKHSWDTAVQSPITGSDVLQASQSAVAALDQNFFRVRFDRLKPSEKKYLRAMAELGSGPHRSGDIAAKMGRAVSTFAPVRASLITKGMVWSPSHGDTAFTVPLFDEFMKRIMPGEDWKS